MGVRVRSVVLWFDLRVSRRVGARFRALCEIIDRTISGDLGLVDDGRDDRAAAASADAAECPPGRRGGGDHRGRRRWAGVVHGILAYAWDAGDTAGRRFAAVSLMRIKAATQLEVAEAFAVRPATVRRWDAQHCDAGVAGLLPERKGPKRKSNTHRRHGRGHPSAACGRSVLPRGRRRHRGVGGQCSQRPQTRWRRR